MSRYSSPGKDDAVARAMSRRDFIRRAATGTVITALGGGLYMVAQDDLTRAARAETKPDGRPRLPPGQRVISKLKPMGGRPGDASPGAFSLRIHGAVANPLTLDFAELLKQPQVEMAQDVHCVTGWSVLGANWKGVQLKHLAQLARLDDDARHVIFEAAHGYTANVRLDRALQDNVLIGHRLDGRPLAHTHGGPVRAVVPDQYFWKSAKWLTGVRFVRQDEPGYWERRGYHNIADPWKEQRHG